MPPNDLGNYLSSQTICDQVLFEARNKRHRNFKKIDEACRKSVLSRAQALSYSKVFLEERRLVEDKRRSGRLASRKAIKK